MRCYTVDADFSQSFVRMTGEKIGLVVITLERYFKIVHAIAHRKYYRDWMTSVGVAGPWWAWRNLGGRGLTSMGVACDHGGRGVILVGVE